MMRKRTMWSGGGDDPTNGHPYVEIGGIKWATMNIGAESETDYGLYFQWGDTTGYTSSQLGSGDYQKPFGFTDYKFSNGTNFTDSIVTKYNSSDGKTVLDLSDDAARLHWGSYWRMPTQEEFYTLSGYNKTYVTNYQNSGVNGILFTDSSKELFFPFGGYIYSGNLASPQGSCVLWTNTLSRRYYTESYSFHLYSDEMWIDDYMRYYGYAIRPVFDDSNVQ